MAVFDDTLPWQEKLQLYPHSVEWADNIPVAHKAEAIKVTLEKNEPLRTECAHFLTCIENRQTPRTDGKEGLRVLTVLNACQTSLEKERLRQVSKKPAKKSTVQVHETAEIDQDVAIGAGTKIWHYSHIMSGSKIGEHCNIGQNVVLGPNVTIGNGCKIQNNVSVYKGVTLEDNVFCGPSMVFTNVYNPRCEFPRKNKLRKTLVKQGATLGANCTIVCGITIGEYAFIGAVVTRDVPDFALMVGNPAKQVGWMSKYGERLNLPLSGDGEDKCPHTGLKYQLRNGRVVCR